jgi:hypothetical protein
LFVFSRCPDARACVSSGLLYRLLAAIIFIPILIAPPPADTWMEVNAPGFSEHAGPYTGQEAFDLTVFKGRLYLGMEGRTCARIWRSDGTATGPFRQADWEQVVSNGFDGTTDCAEAEPTTDNDHIDSLEPFGEYLYASTAMQTNDKRGTQVWRSPTGDAGTWMRVNRPGFGLHTNANFKDMIEYAGLLCGGTGNPGDDGIPSGAQIWCTDGVTPDPTNPDELQWRQHNLDGFGQADNVKTWSSAVFDGALYFGVEGREMDGSIWRTRNLADPQAWERVFSPDDLGLHASRVDVLQSFDGKLYIGMEVAGMGTHIYRSASGDRYTWKPVVQDGFGSATTGRLISDASAVLDGVFYVGVLDQGEGVGVWATSDGMAWQIAAPLGFGRATTFAAELTAFDGELYAWTSDYDVGQGVWRRRAAR